MVAPSVPEELPQDEHSDRSLSSSLGDKKPLRRLRKRTLNIETIAESDSSLASEQEENQTNLGDKKKLKRRQKRTLKTDRPDSDRSTSDQVESRDREALLERTHKRKFQNLGDRKIREIDNDRTLNLNELIQAAYQLPRSDVQALADALQGMMEAWEVTDRLRGQDEAELLEVRTLKQRKPASMRGHFELKMINGCGPYAYLRWWSGGKHRSSYLGKARPKP